MDLQLNGRRALVTGSSSSSGIGEAIARMLVEEGRVIANAVIARLHADPVFQKGMKAAKAEAKKIAKNPKTPDRAQETAAIGS